VKFLWRCFRLFSLLGLLVLIGVIAWVSWLLSGQRYQQLLTEQLSALFGARVQVASSHLSLNRGLGVQLDDVTIKDDADAVPFFTAAQVEMRLNLAALWRGDLLFHSVNFVKPHFQVTAEGKRFLQLLQRLRSTPTLPPGSFHWLLWLTQGLSPTLAVQELQLQEAEMTIEATPGGALMLTEADAKLLLTEQDKPQIALSATLKSKSSAIARVTLHLAAAKEVNVETLRQSEWTGDLEIHDGQLQQLGRLAGEEWPVATVTLNGRLQGKGEGPIELTGAVTASDLKLADLWLRTARLQLTKARWAGVATKGALRAFAVEAQIEQALGEVGKDAAPLSLSGGEVTLRDEELTATKLRGSYGKASQLTDASFTLKKLTAKSGPTLDAAINAEVDLRDDLFRLLTALTPPQAESLSQLIGQPQGRAAVQFRVQRAGTRGKVGYSGDINLQQASGHVLPWKLDLDEVSGALQFDADIVKLNNVAGRVGQSWVTVQGSIKDYTAPARTIELQLASTEIHPSDVAPFLPAGKLLPQSGALAGQLKVVLSPNEHMPRLDGRLTFSRVHLDLVDFLRSFEVVDGELLLAGHGGSFVIKQGQFPGGAFSGRGRIDSWEPLRLDLSGDFPELNLEAALDLNKPDDGAPKESTREVRTDITSRRLHYKGADLENVHFSCYWHGRQADLHVERVEVASGKMQGDATLWPDIHAAYLTPQLREVDVERFFQTVGSPTESLTGTMSSTGTIYMPNWAKWDELAEWQAALSVSVRQGVAHRIPILVRLWSVLSMQGLLRLQLPSLPTEGLAFSSLTGDFKMGNGTAFTQNLSLDGSSVRLDGRGKINLGARTLDLRVALVPLHGITSSVAKVPLAGELLARSADYLTTLNFQVSGPYADPSVTPVLVDLGGR
jgi:hypothetical protein